jgi:hypothetical protein
MAALAAAWRCGCGYEFGQTVERVRALLRDQQASAWIALAVVAFVDATAVFGAVFAAIHGWIVVSAFGFTALTLVTARSVRRLLITRASLRQLAERDAAIPRAVVRRR